MGRTVAPNCKHFGTTLSLVGALSAAQANGPKDMRLARIIWPMRDYGGSTGAVHELQSSVATIGELYHSVSLQQHGLPERDGYREYPRPYTSSEHMPAKEHLVYRLHSLQERFSDARLALVSSP